MIHRLFLVATILVGVAVGGWQRGIHSQSSTLDQSLPSAERSRAFRTSTQAGSSITTVMSMVGAASGVPIVFEIDPEHSSRTAQDFSVVNHTARETLDAFVQLNPSYLWRELDDVVVVRPHSAWVNADHPFNRRGVTVAWTNVTARDVLDNVAVLLVGPQARHDGPRDQRPFSISVQGGSLLEVLMKAAKARGDLVWFIGTMGDGIALRPDDALGFFAMSPDGYPDLLDPIGGVGGLQNILKWKGR